MRYSHFLCPVLALGVGVAAHGASIDSLYGVGLQTGTNAPSLFTIDSTSGADAPVGPLGDQASTPFGLAASGGALYTFDGSINKIRQIDPVSGAYIGAPISIGTINLKGEGDIAFGMNGIGYLTTAGVGETSNTPALYTFDLVAGTSNFVAMTSDAIGSLTIDGLAFDPTSSLLYALTAEDDRLYTLNTATGFLSPVGTGLGVSPASGYGALTFEGGTLYGIINDALYSVNPTTGVATAVGDGLDYGSISGLVGTVPEPSSLAMFSLGLCLLSRRPRRK